MSRSRILFGLLLAALLGGAGGCGGERAATVAKYVESREVMSTVATLTLIASDPAEAGAAMEAGFAFLDSVDAWMSAHRSGTAIDRVNRLAVASPVPVDTASLHVLAAARDYARLTGGAFDVTVGPLLELWRRCAREQRWPPDDTLAAVRARAGSEKLLIDVPAGTVAFAAAGMRVDLGGIAKGYGIDGALAAVRAAGARAGIVEVGGDLRCFGEIPGALIGREPREMRDGLWSTESVAARELRPWPLGLQSPFGEVLLGRIELTDRALATSGHYRRYATIAGRRVSHIVDPRSGLPVEDPAGVSVIAGSCLAADALATAISVLGVERGLALAESLPGVEALIVTGEMSAPELRATSGFPALVARNSGRP